MNLELLVLSIFLALLLAYADRTRAQHISSGPVEVTEVAQSTPKPASPGMVTFRQVPNNDWTPATQITLNGKPYYSESAEKPYSLRISTNTTSPIIRAEVPQWRTVD